MSASASRKVRQNQYEKAQGALKKREEALAAADTDASSMGRDPMLRKLKAELRQATSRLNAIDAVQEQLRKAAEEKKAKTREAKPKKDKKAEGTEQPASEKKAKGEKKAKKK
jgi:tRNA A37 threonylcarbamoyladenosine dehydratase